MWYHLDLDDPWIYRPSVEKRNKFFKKENIDRIEMHARMSLYDLLEEKTESHLYSEDYKDGRHNEHVRQKVKKYRLEATLYHYTLKAIENELF